ncbi:CrcB family protein [Niallia nealsonii]|uniref:CrcB family protein n=1 Tax=Niallia nealsonii TaxID=115979 RepID=UPI002E25D723|nr:CrcB family protein [Niallia nealsonii]
MIVNLLGLLVGLHAASTVYMLFGIGFLGAFTTFTTLAVEGVQLMLAGKSKGFLLYPL